MYVKSGPYGPYVQLGEVSDEHPKPKRTSIPKFIAPEDLTVRPGGFAAVAPPPAGAPQRR